MNVNAHQWQWQINALCPSPRYFYLIDYGGRVVVKSMLRHVAGQYNILMDRSYMLVLGKSFGVIVVYFFLSESNCTVGECLIPFSCISRGSNFSHTHRRIGWRKMVGLQEEPPLVLTVCEKLKGVTCCSYSVKPLYIFAQ